MNTDKNKKVLSPEQKARKNELARALRSKKRFEVRKDASVPSGKTEKQVIGDPVIDEEDMEDTEDTEDTEVTEVMEDTEDTAVTEDPEMTRKKAIADKRRASLALARSKIKPKSQITKEKNEEIEKIKEENERLKDEAEIAKQVALQRSVAPQRSIAPKVIKKYIIEKPKRSITRQKQREQRGEPETINYLAVQSYAEKLQMKFRENMLNRVMYDTFM